MSDTYIQYEIVKRMPDGEHHRIAFMTADMLDEWKREGWRAKQWWSDTIMVKNKENRLVPIWSVQP